MTIPIDDICSETDVANEVGGAAALSRLIPAAWSGATTIARERARDEVLRALLRRTPPIREGDLADVSELKTAVVAGTLEHLYRIAATTPDSIHWENRRVYADRFQEEIDGCTPTLNGDLRGAALSFATERR